ncbi:MAG: LysM peptidoglycan-binding domain-containing protein [Chloroflexi bacterium]|nr:MAG: LysM peptidoglycan-binding domain-containing protein [Chloroflexota bacterium]
MLNRTPTNTSNTINAYRKKRQQKGPFLMYGAIALVVIGFILLVVWLTRPDQPLGQLFATETPTPTVTFTATTTSTPTVTPTITETPTQTLTATPSTEFPYTVQENDSLEAIAQKFNLGNDGSLLIYYRNQEEIEQNEGVIFVGQNLIIPPPGSVLPTTTPIPADMPRGRLIEYRVLPGDTLAGIAVRFNSVQENILTANPDMGEDVNALRIGQVLQIPVNLITATATLPSTSTPVTPTVAGGQPTAAATTAATKAAATSSSSGSGSSGTGTAATCDFQENAQFVSQLQQLINDERAKAGLPALVINPQLNTAAKAHATDMVCKNYLSHIGLDGSTPEDRVEKAGFTASLVVEDLFALHPAYGGNPQAAFDWWMSDPASKADLLNANTTVFGIAYTSMEQSLLGGYFVVVSAKP